MFSVVVCTCVYVCAPYAMCMCAYVTVFLRVHFEEVFLHHLLWGVVGCPIRMHGLYYQRAAGLIILTLKFLVLCICVFMWMLRVYVDVLFVCTSHQYIKYSVLM